MAVFRRLLLACLVATSCARDLCDQVVCQQPESPVCLGESALQRNRPVGTCEPSTGTCIFQPPVMRTCGAGEVCSEGACRCVPSQCAGCCLGNGGCVPVHLLTEQLCGAGGAACTRCADNAACQPALGCVSCPPHHVVRSHQCVDDDVSFDVSLDNAARWPPPPLDGGVTLWHVGPAAEVTLRVTARSPSADVNGTGRSAVDVPVSLRQGMSTVHIEVRAPSGRSAEGDVEVVATRAISTRAGSGGTCQLTRGAKIACNGSTPDAGVFVGVSGDCGLTVEGTVWCLSGGTWEQRFAVEPDVRDVSVPCVLTRERVIACQEDAGVVRVPGEWTAVECRTGACCGLSADGSALCWGSHPYNLFDTVSISPDPVYRAPRAVHGLPDRYVRLASGHKTFFAQNAEGAWTAASNRMGFPGPAPYVLPGPSISTLKLDSPYYCVMGLEMNGSAWARTFFDVATPSTVVDGGGATFIDFAPTNEPGSAFTLLTSDYALVPFSCP